jgi:uncharacterized protein YndB with AHSA1/START domain
MEKTNMSSCSIEKNLFIKAAPERVFQALSEKAELERWFVRIAEVDMRPGGALRFEWSPEIVERGKILVLEPSHRLSYTWEAFSPDPTTITFEVTAENDGTRLQFIHAGIGEGEGWGNYYNGMGHGWDIHLKNLTTWLETGTCPPPGPTGSL